MIKIMNKMVEKIATTFTPKVNTGETETTVNKLNTPAVTSEPETVQIYASFADNRNVTITVDTGGENYAVESFYEIGALFAAPIPQTNY